MPDRPKLILINGMPGTGKTTLAAKFKTDLGLPTLGKDMLKEFFFDTIGVGGRDDSRLIGKAVSEMMYILAEDYVAAGRSLILESAYFVEFARPEFARIAKQYDVDIIEIYCQTDQAIRRQRFIERNESGLRHQGHVDGAMYADMDPDKPEPYEVYAPIEVGKVVRIDTTHFGESEYNELIRMLKDYLNKEG